MEISKEELRTKKAFRYRVIGRTLIVITFLLSFTWNYVNKLQYYIQIIFLILPYIFIFLFIIFEALGLYNSIKTLTTIKKRKVGITDVILDLCSLTIPIITYIVITLKVVINKRKHKQVWRFSVITLLSVVLRRYSISLRTDYTFFRDIFIKVIDIDRDNEFSIKMGIILWNKPIQIYRKEKKNGWKI